MTRITAPTNGVPPRTILASLVQLHPWTHRISRAIIFRHPSKDTLTLCTMPPKRRVSGPAAKSQQSTLAFHGGANKVTKAGVRAQDAKKDILSKSATKAIAPEVIDLQTVEESEPTTVEADIIDQTEKEVAAQKAESNPEDEAARRITDAAIKKYWAAKEKQRLAPRVHQDDLSLHEKVLREFDMSGQYGVRVT